MVEVASTHLHGLESAAADAGDETFVVMDEVAHTFEQVRRDVETMARGLLGLGLTAGDRVLIMLPNSIEALWVWLGTERIGAIDVPVSVEAMGASLRHMLVESRPRAVAGTPELLQRLGEVAGEIEGGCGVEVVLALGEVESSVFGTDVPVRSISGLMTDAAESPGKEELPPLPLPGATATVMFSSGTTGPPKGVMLSHGYYGHGMHAYDEVFPLHRGQSLYCTQPLCHIDPRMVLMQSMAARASVVLRRKFSASQCWADVERYDVDGFIFIGAMLHLLFKQPEAPRPARRRIGLGSAIPPSIHAPFSERFNVDLLEGYGMTEFYTVFCQYPGEYGPGDVGRELPGVEVRIVDDQDAPVPDGEPGQLLVRPENPHAHMQGYWNRPDATVEVWQGLWFRTGDVMRRLPNGRVQYVGRVKDSIRRRGENVSAWEVETVADRLDVVLESAAIGVPAEVGDEDIALFIVPLVGVDVDPVAIRASMAQDLPRFALPRFVEVVSSLPKTPSERVAKAVLRAQGLSSNAYDLEDRTQVATASERS